MKKLTETPGKYFKKRKILSLKKFAPAKKSKCMFLHFNIFRKKMEIKEKKTDVHIFTCFFLKNQSKII
jgi:hypothetical protein